MYVTVYVFIITIQTEVSSPLASSPLQDTDEKHIYNEYTEEQIYETVAESPVIVSNCT